MNAAGCFNNNSDDIVDKDALAHAISDLKKGTLPLEVISRNMNVHGGFSVSLISESYELASQGLCENVIVKSSYKLDDVISELQAIIHMNNCLPNGFGGVSVVKPLYEDVIVSDNNRYHMLIQRVKGKSLESVLNNVDNGTRLHLLQRVAAFTALSHVYMNIQEEGQNDFNEFEKYASRFLEFMGQRQQEKNAAEDNIKTLEKNIFDIYGIFSDSYRYFRRDATASNWIISNMDKTPSECYDIVAIDWEKSRPSCPREFDLSKLLSQGNYIPINSDGDKIRDLIIDTYIYAFKDAGGEFGDDKELFKTKVALADGPKAFTFFSYAFDKPHLYPQIRGYINNAIRSFDKISSSKLSDRFRGSEIRQMQDIYSSLLSFIPDHEQR